MCLILVVGIMFKKLLIIFKLVCKIGIMVIFLFVNVFCVDLVIGVLILMFFNGILCDILYVINVEILLIIFWKILVL